MSLRVAIVGCGKMGRVHARAAGSLGARVAWLCDPEVARAAELSAECGGAPVAGVDEIDWSSIDAVFVCTPPFTRGPVEQRAIAAGVPFFVEKPIGLAAEQIASVRRALAARPVIHSVGYMNRYRRSVLEARARVSAERILGLCCSWSGNVYKRPWWLDASRSGGPFNEQCTHLVDLCRFFAGEIAEVSAVVHPSPDRAGMDDTVAVAARFGSGACGTILYSCLAQDKHIGFDLFTSSGRVRLEGWDLQLCGDEGGSGPEEDIFRVEVEAFFQAIEAGDQSLVRCDLEDALRTQKVVDAIARSAREGKAQAVSGERSTG